MQDTIERQMIFKASQQKVWDAITKPELINRWFGTRADFDKLEVGQKIIFAWASYNHTCRAVIEEVMPISRFVYSWEHQEADFDIPLADLPLTRVTFALEEVEGGTRLTLTETGFSSLPEPENRFKTNSSGWDAELQDLQEYVEAQS